MVQMPGRFMNASKGDVVLAPSGNGLIGQLLTQVDPPQHYSHSGIMTRNYDEITHCTANEARVQAYPQGSIIFDGPEPTDGFRTDVVKYGWPGTITQTVENTVHGEWRNDPESGQQYYMQAFDGSAGGATIAGHWTIIPPMVVKPDPMLETEALRLRLHAVADDAAAHTGKFHYRFYCYTDPTIGKTTTAPAEARWAKGTSPGVCSSFIWLMMKRNGMHLQGAGETVKSSDLNPQEVAAGAKIGPATPDGLYLYSAGERDTAAKWLNQAISDQVHDALDQKGSILGGVIHLGGAIDFFTKITTHVSNEFLNAFARDLVQQDDDNTGWQNTKDANAVSPDNIMDWNGPSAPTPGPYGYAEPLAYREPRYELVGASRWAPSHGTGTVSGVATFHGSPEPRAEVRIGGKSAGTDARGHFVLHDVPYGKYLATATKEMQDRTFLSGKRQVTVGAPNVSVSIALQLPPRQYRTVVVDGTFHTHYKQSALFVTLDEKTEDMPFHQEWRLGPDKKHLSQSEAKVEHDVKDAHAILSFELDWQKDNSVQVKWSLNLHDASANDSFRLAEDGKEVCTADCSADNDDSHVHFTVANKRTQA
jgi:hypothetical protein